MVGSRLAGKLPQSLSSGLTTLGQELVTQNQDALGWLCSKTRNAVTYSDPQTRQRVQDNLDHAIGLLCVAHIMAVFEKYLPCNYWPALLTQEELQRLKAYRHIRNCAANGFTGLRPTADHAEFNTVMASQHPLRGVMEYTDASIFLSPDVLNDLSAFVRRVSNMAIVAAHR